MSKAFGNQRATHLRRSRFSRTGSVLIRLLFAGILISGAAFWIPPGGIAYVEGPPPRKTGAFGEQSCAECHFDGPVNDPGGSLNFAGVPESYVPGQQYQIDIVLARADLRRGGFELAARFRDGPEAGRQAGSLIPVDDRVDVLRTEDDSVEYTRQNQLGSWPGSEAAALTWSIRWQAPERARGPVALTVAANSGNDDASELGDWVYTREILIPER